MSEAVLWRITTTITPNQLKARSFDMHIPPVFGGHLDLNYFSQILKLPVSCSVFLCPGKGKFWITLYHLLAVDLCWGPGSDAAIILLGKDS